MSAPLTPAGEAAVADLAQRYRVSDGAVRSLLDAVIRGGGAMAQFSHPDLGGSGQWMRGGMTMVGDMFNPGLQATVSGICSELASQLGAGAVLVTAPQRGSSASGTAGLGGFSGFGGDWWPEELGRPSSSGGQNDASYAYFPGPRRLAIRRGSAITLYDTGEHSISGVQQQQGSLGSLEFSSQLGTFTVDSLPVISGGSGTAASGGTNPTPATAAAAPIVGEPSPPRQSQSQSQFSFPAPPVAARPAAATPAAAPAPAAPAVPTEPQPATNPVTPAAPQAASPPRVPSAEPRAVASPSAPAPPQQPPAGSASTAAEIGAAIETLAGLRDKGFLTDDEFTAKKTELLARL